MLYCKIELDIFFRLAGRQQQSVLLFVYLSFIPHTYVRLHDRFASLFYQYFLGRRADKKSMKLNVNLFVQLRPTLLIFDHSLMMVAEIDF